MAWPYPDSEGSVIAHLPMPTKRAETDFRLSIQTGLNCVPVNKRHEEPVPECD